MSADIIISGRHLDAMYNAAREAAPFECCGLLGGNCARRVLALYPLRNVARSPQVAYEAAAEDLFAAQRVMRERGERMLAVFHSHPRADDPVPSETDVRLAFYPAAIYFIIGLAGVQPVANAFRLFEVEQRWERAMYRVVDTNKD
ncbi:MAG: M67 family metallopeptidase [Pyrinomonadaceae bacterium]